MVFNGPIEDGKAAAQPLLDSVADALERDIVCRKAPICNRLLESSPSQHLVAHRTKLKAGEPFIQASTLVRLHYYVLLTSGYEIWGFVLVVSSIALIEAFQGTA